MYVAGIISEYNPFHKGHAFHLEQTKSHADAVVCVMSGNFTQRGDAAVFSKAARARCAAEQGADLVLELPLPWAVATAETFARGAVGILAGLGIVNILSFGSESGDLSRLEAAVYWANSPEIKARLKALLSEGMTFAKAREIAVREKAGNAAADALRSPNDTLAVEYLSEIARQNAGLQPITVKRRGASHDSGNLNGEFASASAVRELLRKGSPEAFNHIPEGCAEILREEINAGCGAVFLEEQYSDDTVYRPAPGGLERAVISRLRGISRDCLRSLPDLSEGLENRLYEAVRKGGSWREICEAAKTKRYTMARIRRLLFCAALGIKKEHCDGIPPYINVLALTRRGAEILRLASEKTSLPIITRSSDIKQLDKRAGLIYDLECAAWDLYSLGYKNPTPCGENQRSQTYFYSG